MRISQFTIGFLIISLVAVVFAFFIGDMDEAYTSVDINESSLSVYNKTSELNDLASDMNESLSDMQQGNAADVVGGLLTSGFTVLRTTWTSFGVYTDVTSEALDNANLGKSTASFKSTALIIGVLLFIFAMVGILIGRTV